MFLRLLPTYWGVFKDPIIMMQALREAMRAEKAAPSRCKKHKRRPASGPFTAQSHPALMEGLRAAMAKEKQKTEEKRLKEQREREQIDHIHIDLDTLFSPLSKEEQLHLMSLPQHFEDGSTNPLWLQSRIGVMTGSRIANVAGHGFDRQFLKHMVWPSTHSVCRAFCDYGLENEDRCEDVLRGYLQSRVKNETDPLVEFVIHHCGCVRSRGDRSRGYSPDGYVEETYSDGSSAVVLSEYKCPYTKRLYRPPVGSPPLDVYPSGSGICLYGPTCVPPKPFASQGEQQVTLPIPPYYYDQVQWGMDILMEDEFLRTHPVHCPTMHCYFVVWTPKFSQLCVVPRHPAYAKWLQKRARRFMEREYLRTMRQKQAGRLKRGETEFVLHL